MPETSKRMRRRSVRRKARTRVFAHLEELLAFYGRTAPKRAAILAPGLAPLTYGALRVQAKLTARELRRLGVGRTDRLGVLLPNGPEAAVALVTVAAGAVCVPLNPSFAADEYQRYFGDLRLTALLMRADVNSAARGVAHNLGMNVIDLLPDAERGAGAFQLRGTPARRRVRDAHARSHNTAFVLMTSGTAAQPKLVPLTHRAVCLAAYNAAAAIALAPGDRLLSVLPLFHAHGLASGLLASLAAGSSVVCTPGLNAASFFGWLGEFRPTWYTAVPAIHRAILAAAEQAGGSGQHSLRLIRSASSTLPSDVLARLERLFGAPVIETYGMTEAVSQIAANPICRRKPGSVGRPAGAEIAIMDARGRRLRRGPRGEIVLRGPTISKGYENDPVATRAAFRNGWFRTGDLGYLDRDGYLFIVGRIKEVINRGGQKIAPGDVEQSLLAHPAVLEAAAFPIPHPRLGENIAAAVVVREGAKLTPEGLRDFAGERLARFKVPGLIRFMKEIPKGSTGKIRRNELAGALGMAREPAAADHAPILPRSELERQLAQLWAELLHLECIGMDQDVYALGADSLTVTQLISRLRQRFGLECSFKDAFDAPTVAALAARLADSKKHSPGTPVGLRSPPAKVRDLPVSFQQSRIHVLGKLDPTAIQCHVLEAVRLSGPLNVESLEASITAVCKRHDVLRSRFSERAGELVQKVGTACPRLELRDLRSIAKNKRVAAVRSQALAFLREPFDLACEPPLRARLLRLDKNEHALLIVFHHLVTDGWSQALFWQELDACYGGLQSSLPELPVRYRHFAEWQRSWLRTPEAEKKLSYWRAQLHGLTALPLHTDRPRPERWTGRGARFQVQLPPRLCRELKALGRVHGATLFMTLLAAFQVLLHRYTNHDDIAVGSLIANRNQVDIERLIGMFANTIVLRTDLSGDPPFSEALGRVRQVTLDAYRNQDVPIEEALRSVQLSRAVDGSAWFQAMLLLQNTASPNLKGVSARFLDIDPGTARCDLTLELIPAGEGLTGWFEYSTDLFDPATIARMATHWRTLLEAVVANPQERISRLSILPAEERRRVLIEWNDRTNGVRLGTFSERFARQAERAPNAIAVSTANERLTYRELAQRASAIAVHVAAAGLGRNMVVVLLARRSIDLLAAIIGVQQAGAAFLPLDPSFPAARRAHIIAHSRTPLVLVGQDCVAALDETLSGMPAPSRPQVLSLAELVRGIAPKHAHRSAPATNSFACVIYTSGSTGTPKGAIIEQRGLVNHLMSKISDLELSAGDAVAQAASPSYVMAIWQFLASLLAGARVHICSDEEMRDPNLLAQAVGRERITVLQLVPSLLRTILEERRSVEAFSHLHRLRWLVSTGEALHPDLARAWFRRYPEVPLINVYGQAECSDDVASHALTEAPAREVVTIPIGRPIANTQLYVVDPHLQPVPIGLAGELCVGGVSVGPGYLNEPEQTRRSFVPDSFSRRRGGRLYRTGDRARWRADGSLEFIGRRDHQVKIRGHRIEPAEIEHALMEHPDVQTAAVLPRNDDTAGTWLLAYVVPHARRRPKANALHDLLKKKLPAHMLPAGFMFLERLPLTAPGKLDRSALLAMRQRMEVVSHTFVAPRDHTEALLAGIWSHVLKFEKIGVFDNFFDLGGHSLLAGKVLARVANSFGVSLPVRTLFEAPTLEKFARRIEEARASQASAAGVTTVRVEEATAQSVSIAQENVLRLEREFPDLPQHNLYFTYRLQGPLNVGALERSLGHLIHRHESLRTSFAWANGGPRAIVAAADKIADTIVVEDLAAQAPPTNRRVKALLLKKAELEIEREAWTPFDLAHAPLFRARLMRLAENDHVFVLVFHHIIVDGWSVEVFFDELAQCYGAFVKNRSPQLTELSVQFAHFAQWQRRWSTQPAAEQQLAYWKAQLRRRPRLFHARSANDAISSETADERIHIPDDLAKRLGALSRARGATLFMTLLAAFKALLAAASGRDDICVATAMANRSQQSMERVIGPMENTTLIRTRMDANLSFQEAIDRVRDSVLEAHARQELPFDLLARRLAEEDDLDSAAITQAFFIMQNGCKSFNLPGLACRSLGKRGEGQPVFPVDHSWLTVSVREMASGIAGSCTYKPDLFKGHAAGPWLANYKKILSKAAAEPELSLLRLAAQ